MMWDQHPFVTAAEQHRPALACAISRWEIVGLSVNDVIGSGVYLLPAARRH